MSRAAKVLLPLLLPLVTTCGNAPALQRGAANALLPPEQEVKLGERVDREVRAKLPVIEDASVRTYVQQVGARVARASEGERHGVPVRFEVIDEPSQVNAFTTVGGNIYVFTGLLLAVEDEAELASVLAHEIAHVANRDVAEGLTTQFGLSLLARAALGSDPGAVTQIAAQLAGAGAIAAHTRGQERDADETALRYLVEADYDPRAMTSFFAKMERLAGRRPSAVERFFQSHPAPADRRAELDARIRGLGAPRGERDAAGIARVQGELRRYYASRGRKLG